MKNFYTLLIAAMLIALASQNVNAQGAPIIPGVGGTAIVQPQVIPNPAHDYIKVSWTQSQEGATRIQLNYLSGNIAGTLTSKRFHAGTYTMNFPLNSYAPGTYILKILSPGQNWSKKLIIQ